VGTSAGQAQDKPQDYSVDVVTGDSYAGDEPFPWPNFVDVRPEPGRYRMKMTVADLQFPQLEDTADDSFDIAEVMRSVMNETQYFCVAADDPPSDDWFSQRTDEECSEPQVTVDGGDFNFAQQCRDETGGTSDIGINGTIEPTRARIQLQARASGQEFPDMSMTTRMTAERVGDCD
jgi:hypothetical protein